KQLDVNHKSERNCSVFGPTPGDQKRMTRSRIGVGSNHSATLISIAKGESVWQNERASHTRSSGSSISARADMNWYYVNAGQHAGPVDDGQLEGLVRAGQVQMDTLVWHEGMAQWQALSTVAPGMAAAAPIAPPVATAAPPVGANEVVCAECRRVFPLDETIQFGNV